MHWLFTGLLIGISGATAAYTLWLLRRLFTTAPVPEAAPVPAQVPAPEPNRSERAEP